MGRCPASISRATQIAASIDEDALGRLSKEPYSIRPATRSPGSWSGGSAAHKITSVRPRRRRTAPRGDRTRRSSRMSRRSTGGVTAQEGLRRRDRFGQRRRRGSRFRRDQLRGEVFRLRNDRLHRGHHAGRGVLGHALGTARMPRTLDEPVLGGEPAGLAAQRLQIDVLWIAKKLDRRWAE